MFNKIIGIFKGEYKIKYSKDDLKGITRKDKTIIGLFITLMVLFFCFGFWAGSQYYSIKVNTIVQDITDSLGPFCRRDIAENCRNFQGEDLPMQCLLIDVY